MPMLRVAVMHCMSSVTRQISLCDCDTSDLLVLGDMLQTDETNRSTRPALENAIVFWKDLLEVHLSSTRVLNHLLSKDVKRQCRLEAENGVYCNRTGLRSNFTRLVNK